MKRSFSIITVSKGRLDHLKATLPRMLEQGAAEVIVVDYSCPEGTGDHVAEHFPGARVVRVDNQPYFSNWRGRNAGAAAATSDLLVFCDADTLLQPNAIQWIDDHLPLRSYGFFKRWATGDFNTEGLRLAGNQLKGFHVIPTAAFRRVQGYDELFEGYAAGADTDLEERLLLTGIKKFVLDPKLVEHVIEHGNQERLAHHRDPVQISYGTGLIYRSAKHAALMMRRVAELPIETRRAIYASAEAAARSIADEKDQAGVSVILRDEPVGMPLQLGFERARLKLSIRIEVSGSDRIERIPD